MYDRGVKPIPERPYSGFKYRIYTLLGTTGWKMAKYRGSVWDSISSVFRVAWRPHLLMALIYEVTHILAMRAHTFQLITSVCLQGMVFGFSIGTTVCAGVNCIRSSLSIHRSPLQSFWANLAKKGATTSPNLPSPDVMLLRLYGRVSPQRTLN